MEVVNKQFIYPFRVSDIISCATTHGLATLLAIFGIVILIIKAFAKHDLKIITGIIIFGICLVLSYLFSTLYHSLARTRARKVFQILDHSFIYLLIAGTYSPVILIALKPALAWAVFTLIWLLAISGVILKSVAIGKHPAISAIFYILMGWIALLFIAQLWIALPAAAFFLILSGGIIYTTGVAFFAFNRIKFFHFIWHLFVMAGSISHYFAILIILNKF